MKFIAIQPQLTFALFILCTMPLLGMESAPMSNQQIIRELEELQESVQWKQDQIDIETDIVNGFKNKKNNLQTNYARWVKSNPNKSIIDYQSYLNAKIIYCTNSIHQAQTQKQDILHKIDNLKRMLEKNTYTTITGPKSNRL